MIRIRISDPRSLGSWLIKWTDEFLSRVDSSVPLIYNIWSKWCRITSDPDPDHPKGTHPKTILDSGFHAMDSSPETVFRILCQWNLDSGFQSLVGFRIPWAVYSGIQCPGFRISGFPYMGRSSMHSILMMRSKFCFLLTCDNQWTSVYFPHIHSLTLLNNQERQPRDHIMITCLYLNKQSELSFHVKIHIFVATAPSQATS